jgi:hypothetical protein
MQQACAATGIDSCAECLNVACSFCGLPYEGPGQPAPGMCLTREGCVRASSHARAPACLT